MNSKIFCVFLALYRVVDGRKYIYLHFFQSVKLYVKTVMYEILIIEVFMLLDLVKIQIFIVCHMAKPT